MNDNLYRSYQIYGYDLGRVAYALARDGIQLRDLDPQDPGDVALVQGRAREMGIYVGPFVGIDTTGGVDTSPGFNEADITGGRGGMSVDGCDV